MASRNPGGTARLSLDVDEIIACASAASGLGSYLDDGLKGRLATVVQRLNEGAAFTEGNLAGARDQVVDTLVIRLRLERDWADNPDILRQAVERPIFVIGYARTGTSAVQCLLGEDLANRVLTWRDSAQPSPPYGLDPAADVARTVIATRRLADWLEHAPGILPPHPYWDKGIQTPIEDEDIYTLDFLTTYATRYFRVPSAPVSSGATAPGLAYAFHRKMFQQLQWNGPPRRWVSKGVFHQFGLDALLAAFPDACCIWTHRNPVQVAPSLFHLYSAVYESVKPGFDRPAYAAAAMGKLVDAYRLAVDSPVIDDPRVFHVRFNDFMVDQAGTIRAAYDHFGLPMTPSHDAAMRHWLQDPANQSDRYGKPDYSFDGFGLDPQRIAEDFAFYTERFGL